MARNHCFCYHHDKLSHTVSLTFCSSFALPPYQTRCNSPPPPTFHRLWYGGRAKDERKKMQGTYWFSPKHTEKQRNPATITNCKHFYVFILQFITKTNLIQSKISHLRFAYLLFVIFYCIFIAFCLTLHPILGHNESKNAVNLTQIKENSSKSYEKALDYPYDHDGHYRLWRFVRQRTFVRVRHVED